MLSMPTYQTLLFTHVSMPDHRHEPVDT